MTAQRQVITDRTENEEDLSDRTTTTTVGLNAKMYLEKLKKGHLFIHLFCFDTSYSLTVNKLLGSWLNSFLKTLYTNKAQITCNCKYFVAEALLSATVVPTQLRWLTPVVLLPCQVPASYPFLRGQRVPNLRATVGGAG